MEILSGYAYEYPGAGHMEAEAEGQTKWHVQSNVTATHQVKTHEVIWQHGVIEEEATAFNGKGSGEGFLGALRPGDRIAIIARAMVCSLNNNLLFMIMLREISSSIRDGLTMCQVLESRFSTQYRRCTGSHSRSTC